MDEVTIGKARILHGDCLTFMRELPDKFYDLAVVDVPYGINAGELFGGEARKSGNGCAMKSAFQKKDWDYDIPDKEYFEQLFRISNNQIIWGANYLTIHLPPSMGWIVWDKDNGTTKFSDCELAYTSFDSALRKFKYTWNGMIQGDMKNKETRIHQCQKPIKLYEWLLTNYAKQGDKIFDSHGGSMSSVIAALNLGFEITCLELDEDYYKSGVARVRQSQQQARMFEPEVVMPKQASML